MRTKWTWLWMVLVACGIMVWLLAVPPALGAEGGDGELGELAPEVLAQLGARFIGPVGNRVPAVVGVAGDPNVYFVGTASGGIFRTTDGGAHFEPVFDDEPVASIGALAVAPSDPNVVWAGTGETFIRSNVSIGNGVYRSTDGGETWQHLGLEKTGRIGRIVVDPRDPDVAFVAALGHCYGPQPERGLYRTRDGGASWEQVLFVDEETGAIDVVMDPTNPRILYAATWQMVIWPWGRQSGGPGSGLFASRDGGNTWKRLEGESLPEPPWGKIGLALSAADPKKVYALIETSSNRDFAPVGEHQGVLWRSDDGGGSWQRVSSDHTLVQRPLYYTRAVAAPDDADEIHFLAVQHSLSLDGGATIRRVNDAGGDHHDMWIDPADPRRMIVGHDQGISISTDGGESWRRPLLPNAQMYHVATDGEIPYFVYGSRQDGPSFRGPSNSLTGGPIPIGAWHSVGGCESGFAVPDPVESHIVWSGCYDGILERYDRRTGHARNVMVWPEAIESMAAADLDYRFQWTFPIAISPHDHQRVYVGSQYVHVTTDGGQSWQAISPDLTTDDPQLQVRTGGLTADDASPTVAPVVFALAESPLEEGLIWAGTNDGQVQLTRDGGESWANVTAALPELPPLGTVSNVEPSRHAAGTCYLTVDRHQMGDTGPYIYKTADYGASWEKITGGIPEGTHSYAHVVREDPVRPGLLFAGTENALYVSFDDGGRWQALDVGVPPAPVHDLAIQEHFGDLVVGTYGRGFWILDDITPLRQLTSEVLASPLHLFAPRPAYRFRYKEGPMRQPGDPAAGRNPRYGVPIHFYLAEVPKDGATEAEGAEAEGAEAKDGETEGGGEDADEGEAAARGGEGGGELTLEILDAAGEVVQEIEDLEAKRGINRVWWNLSYEESTEVKLRTPPEEHGHEKIPEKGWRELSDGGRFDPLVTPGTYTVRLRMGDEERTAEIEVRKDPASAGTLETIQATTELGLGLRDLQSSVAEMINEIEEIRLQLEGLEERLESYPEGEELGEAARELAGGLEGLEGRFFDLRLTGASQDFLRWPRKLYGKLSYLAYYVLRSDLPPTDSQRQVYELLAGEVAAAEAEMESLRGEVGAFNRLLAEKGVPHLLATASPRPAP